MVLCLGLTKASVASSFAAAKLGSPHSIVSSFEVKEMRIAPVRRLPPRNGVLTTGMFAKRHHRNLGGSY